MPLYHDINDYIFYLKCIKYCQREIGVEIYALCLMPNHYHLLIKDIGLELSLIMDTINSVYARYFNEKYKHKGCIFDGPFKSKIVGDDYGFTRLYRYIIRNPIAAGLAYNLHEYPWVTSTKEKDIFGLINFEYVNKIFYRVCNESYEEYLKFDVDDLWVDDIEVHRLEDSVAEEYFRKILFKLTGKTDFSRDGIDNNTQKEIIRSAYFRGVTLIQLRKITGLSINILSKIKK